MSKLRAGIKREFRNLLPVWLFFFFSFFLVELTQELLFRELGLPAFHFAALTGAAIGALIAAKIFLIVDHIPWVDRYNGRPLFYVVLWKTALYSAAAILLQFLEEGIKLLLKGMSVADASRNVLFRVTTPHFWVVQIWVVTLFFFFIFSREIIGAIGIAHFRVLLFGDRKAPKTVKRAA